MIITPEMFERLKRNLIFNKQDEENGTAPVGALTILVRDETPDSIQELFDTLSTLAKSEKILGLDLSKPE